MLGIPCGRAALQLLSFINMHDGVYYYYYYYYYAIRNYQDFAVSVPQSFPRKFVANLV